MFLHDFDAQTLRNSEVFTAELTRRGLRTICPIADRAGGRRSLVRTSIRP